DGNPVTYSLSGMATIEFMETLGTIKKNMVVTRFLTFYNLQSLLQDTIPIAWRGVSLTAEINIGRRPAGDGTLDYYFWLDKIY
uniref:hypothetical protein n=1 Tax=Staphylococcus aureus TaxID=1280 RepID=UPI0038CDBD88